MINSDPFTVQGSIYATFLHDVVYLYAVIVDEMIKYGLDYRNGTDVMHRAKNFQFDGKPTPVIRSSWPRK